jgi:cyclic beta-1,2-glucan synthetase
VTVDPRKDGKRTPAPWTNVVANPEFGFLVSESGAGFTWSRNSHERRLTPWSNDPILDPHGEALYVADEGARTFWSPLPGPAPTDAPYEASHGFGYSSWRHTSHGIEQSVTMFVPPDESAKIVRVRLRALPGDGDGQGRTSKKPRRVALVSYARLVLGDFDLDGARMITSEIDANAGAVYARSRRGAGFDDAVVFAAAVAPSGAEVSFTADRLAFLGAQATLAAPAALCANEPLDGRAGENLDPCAAVRVALTIAPGEDIDCAFVLGEAKTREQAAALLARLRAAGAVEDAFTRARTSWRELLGAIDVETPSEAVNLVANGWALYQAASCRLWGRSAFYQSGGAFGFRDQLQDSAAFVYARPAMTRAQIVLHAAHQFREGDVLHWWHPPIERGTRTRFADDLCWLPYITAFYVATTGDDTVLDETEPFVDGPLLAAGQDEAYIGVTTTDETATVYEHCCRALDRSLTCGTHGLPLFGTGDWNDGMNRVGRGGKGESVWMAFFLYDILGRFAPLCRARADEERARNYEEYREHLRGAIENVAWDGDWYRRGYYDDGTVLGSAQSDECRIDVLAQSWAVLSGAARPDRCASALDAVERMLVVPDPGLIRLLTPPFDRTAHDPGYIKGYVPGIRENGGQYTHGALWAVRAAAEFGQRERAARWLEMILPLNHTATRAAVDVYKVEPYVVVADVYGVDPHMGRGGWTWYTGSAAWMYRTIVESVLGLTVERGRTLVLRPRIPDAWASYRMR